MKVVFNCTIFLIVFFTLLNIVLANNIQSTNKHGKAVNVPDNCPPGHVYRRKACRKVMK